MRIPRIYTDQPLVVGDQVLLEMGPSHHLTHVLRLQKESEIRLFNGTGVEFKASIVDKEKRSVQLEVLSEADKEPINQLSIQLGNGISKGERMDFAIQKSVELGVTTITPLLTERIAVHLPDKRWKKRHAHWLNTVISACEQSGRNRLPVIDVPTPLTAWLLQLGDAPGILLDQNASLHLYELPHPRDTINLLAGPEGGLSENEKKQATHSGYIPVRIGPRIMRTETAPLAAIAAIQTLWGGF